MAWVALGNSTTLHYPAHGYLLTWHRKTQIALAYVYWLQEMYPEVSVFWVHASNAARFRQAFASIAQERHVPGCNDSKADVLPLVKAWLERKEQGRWLMVIDNADDLQLFCDEPEKLGRYIPECAHGSILITTRNKQVGSRLTKGKRPVEVREMDDGDSTQLLRTAIGEDDLSSDDLSTLSSRLEYLPLALVQAAAFIQENTLSALEYLQLLDKSDYHLVDLLSKEFEAVGRDSETPRAVAETWILSFQQIQQNNAFAGELLSLMSFFDRQEIPEEFLSYYGMQQNEVSGGDIQLQQALGVLKAFSFAIKEKDQSLDIHRLVQLVTRKWLARNKTISKFAGQALLAVSHCFPFGNFENWATCSQYLPHAYAVLKQDGTRSEEEEVAKASLLHCTAGYLYYRGQWKESERLQLRAVKLRRGVLGLDHPDTLTSVANLASTYGNQGRWDQAEKLEVEVMETRKTKLGADHPDTLTSMANLAVTYWEQNRLDEAETLEVEVLDISKAKLGTDHPDTLGRMANLAFTWRSQGRHADALALMESCTQARQRVLGENHPGTISSLSTIERWR